MRDFSTTTTTTTRSNRNRNRIRASLIVLNFILLATVTNAESTTECDDGTTINYVAKCGVGTGDVALVFATSSNPTQTTLDTVGQKDLMSNLAELLDIGLSRTRIAAVSSATIHFGFVSHHNTSSVVSAIEAIQPITDATISESLTFVKDTVIRVENGERTTDRNTVILLVEGDVGATDGQIAAAALKSSNTDLIVFGVKSSLITLQSLSDDAYAFDSWSDGIQFLSSHRDIVLGSTGICESITQFANGCRPCGCNEAGSRSSVCNTTTGECSCKTQVVGDICDTCNQGYTALSTSNGVGCSGVPSLSVVAAAQVPGLQVRVSWNAVDASDGPITNYTLLRGQSDQDVVSIYSGLGRAFIDTDTSAGATYSYTVKTFTVGGASVSVPAFITVFQDPPGFVLAPTLTTLSSTSVRVSWKAPVDLNGLDRYLVNIDGTQSKEVSGSTLETDIINLNAFQSYSISVTPCNAESCQPLQIPSRIKLPSARPEGVTKVTLVTTENGDGFVVSWDVATKQNGERADYKVFITPSDGDDVRVCLDVAQSTTCTIESLTPATSYSVRVEHFNADLDEGTLTAYTDATTSNLRPEAVPTPKAIERGQTFVVVEINEPGVPNGDIVEYKMTVDGVVVKSVSSTGQVRIENLIPFTSYSIAVLGCTNGGCTSSPSVAMTTVAGAPTDQGFPDLSAFVSTGPTSFNVNISWELPRFPNGPLKSFEIKRRRISEADIESIATVDIAGIESETFNYIDEDLTAFTTFFYQVSVISDFGSASSPFSEVQTSEATPVGLAKPTAATINATAVEVSWELPSTPNGPLVEYTVLVAKQSDDDDDQERRVAFRGKQTAVEVGGLEPFTSYIFVTTFGNNVGTVESVSVTATTDEAAPDPFSTPVSITTARSNGFRVIWDATQNINGVLVSGHLLVAKVFPQDGDTALKVELESVATTGTVVFTNLEANVDYTVVLVLCTSAGCTESPNGAAKTPGTKPEKVNDLALQALGSNSIQVTWSPPQSQNSVIGAYQIYRSGRKIFSGPAESLDIFEELGGLIIYKDDGLTAKTTYAYTIRVYNDFGFSVSETVSLTTPAKTPQDVGLPQVDVLSSSSVKASWTKHSSDVTQDLTYNIVLITATVTSILCSETDTTNCIIKDLTAGQTVTLQLQVCILGGGCGISGLVQKTTLEQTPTGVQTPTTSTQTVAGEMQVSWDPPTSPNGNIEYTLSVQGEFNENYNYTRGDAILQGQDEDSFDLLDAALHDKDVSDSDGTLTFDGSTSVLMLNNGPEIQSNFSIALEFEYQKTTSPQCLVVKTDFRGRRFFSIYMTGGGDRLVFFYRVKGSTVLNYIPFSVQLAEKVSHKLLVSVSSTRISLYVGQTTEPRATFALKGVVDDCGAKTSNCILQIGGRPASTTQQAGDFFFGSISTLNLYTTTALSEFPRGTSDVDGSLGVSKLFAANPTYVFGVGADTTFTVKGVLPFTNYLLRVSAFTSAGSADSNISKVLTAVGSPTGFAPPSITLLSPTVVRVLWSSPERMSGVFRVYELQMADTSDGAEGLKTLYTTGNEKARVFVATQLTPFTSYQFRVVVALQSGHFAVSDWRQFTTAESAPQGVDAGEITDVSSSAFTLSWSRPLLPNGRIKSYSMFLNRNYVASVDAQVTEQSDLQERQRHTLTNLAIGTDFSVVMQACTNGGCSSSDAQNVSTPLGPPIPVDVFLVQQTPRSLVIRWTAVGTTQSYILTRRTKGDTDAVILDNSLVFSSSRALYNDVNLEPGQTYSYMVTSVNTFGTTASDYFTFETARISPLGVSNVTSSSVTATNLVLSWNAPRELWSGIAVYQVMAQSESDDTRRVYFGNETSVLVEGLLPFTKYSFVLSSCVDDTKCTNSEAETVTTLESVPAGFNDAVDVVDVQARALSFQWSSPTQPNGVITSYIVTSQQSGGDIQQTVLNSSTLELQLVQLQPFTNYTVVVTACTKIGCTNNLPTVMATLQTGPESQPNPTLTPLNGGSSVLIEWTEPVQLNGVLAGYNVEYKMVQDRRHRREECEDITDEQTCVAASCVFEGGQCYTDGTVPCFNFFGQESCEEASNCDWVEGTYFNECTDKPTTTPGVTTTAEGSTASPSVAPSGAPSTRVITTQGSTTLVPTSLPTAVPSQSPTYVPTKQPTVSTPTTSPTTTPSSSPSTTPTQAPSLSPSIDPFSVRVVPAGLTNKVTVRELIGYEVYEFRIVAVTAGGETASDWIRTRTLQGVPSGIPAPLLVSVISDTESELEVLPPRFPNGLVVGYSFVYKEQQDGAVVKEQLVQGVGRVNISIFIAGVVFEVATRACTAEGCAMGPNVTIQTADEAIPEGVSTPVLDNRTESTLGISWSVSLPHGRIVKYEVYADNALTATVTSGQSAILESLSPFQTVSVFIRACTTVGCADGQAVDLTTAQAAPEGLDVPIAVPLHGGVSIVLEWSAPSTSNGVVRYDVFISSVPALVLAGSSIGYSGSDVGVNVTINDTVGGQGLEPLTEYTVVLRACTTGGCIDSDKVTTTTLEGAPKGPLEGPEVLVLSSLRTQVKWSAPTQSNGVLTRYQVLRDGEAVYTSSNTEVTTFQDTDVTPETTYTYQYVATTSGGSTISESTTITTFVGTPEELVAPQCDSVSSTEIRISWAAPNQPNGIITEYKVFEKVEGQGFVSVDIVDGTVTSLTATNLSSFASHTFVYQACIRSGCAVSTACTSTTFPDIPAQVQPPQPKPSSPNESVINVTWDAPELPNGNLAKYQVFYRVVDGSNDTTFSQLCETPIDSRQCFHGNLGTFALVEYFLKVFNQVGQASSSIVSGRSGEGLPEGVTPAAISNVGSRSVVAKWTAPTTANGILFYTVVAQSPKLPTVVSEASKLTSATVDGLRPFTTYSFTVSASTTFGSVSSSFVFATTLQDAPEQITAPALTVINDTVVFATWEEPGLPNGVITAYSILAWPAKDPESMSLHCNNTMATECFVTNLAPYTDYVFLVSACTAAGCSIEDYETSTARTAEGVPDELDAPILVSRRPDRVRLSWKPPKQPNGVIHTYYLYDVSGEDTFESGSGDFVDSSISRDTTPNITIVLGNDTNQLLQTFVNDLSPFTEYKFILGAENSAGIEYSPVLDVRTSAAKPSEPLAIAVESWSATELRVTWKPPTFRNGNRLWYTVLFKVYRGGEDASTSFESTELIPEANGTSYILGGLKPHTPYAIRVQSVNKAGNVTSRTWTLKQTCSGIPTAPLEVSGFATSATSVFVQWNPPATTNGDVKRYLVTVDGVVFTQGANEQDRNISDLKSYRNYSVTVQACVTGVCNHDNCSVIGAPLRIQTKPDAPSGMGAPSVVAFGPKAIDVAWQPPTLANGKVLEYMVVRDGSIQIYQGLDLSFRDVDVDPGSSHYYTVAVETNGGETISEESVTVTTPKSAPEDIPLPLVRVVATTSFVLSWLPPKSPHGRIVNYSVVVDDTILYTGLQRVQTINVAHPNQEYSVYIQACIAAGCGRSDTVQLTTLCSEPTLPPLNQIKISTTGVATVSWDTVQRLNCDSVLYVVQYVRANDPTATIKRTNSITQNNNDDARTIEVEVPGLAAGIEYTFQLVGRNAIGAVEGPLSLSTVPESQPQLMAIPSLTPIRLGFIISWTVPLQPNGNIVAYGIRLDGEVLTSIEQDSSAFNQQIFDVTNLAPLQNYTFSVAACNSAGCAQSENVTGYVAAASSTTLPPPAIVLVTTNSATVAWSSKGFEGARFRILLKECDQGILDSLGTCFGIVQTIDPATSSADSIALTSDALASGTTYEVQLEAYYGDDDLENGGVLSTPVQFKTDDQPTTMTTSTALDDTTTPAIVTTTAVTPNVTTEGDDSDQNTTTFPPISNFNENNATSNTIESTIWIVAVFGIFAILVSCIMYRSGSFKQGVKADMDKVAQSDPFWMGEEDGLEHAPTSGDFVPKDKRLVGSAFGMPVPLAGLRGASNGLLRVEPRKEPRPLISETPRVGHARTVESFTTEELQKPKMRRMSMKINRIKEVQEEVKSEWKMFEYQAPPPFAKDAEDIREENEAFVDTMAETYALNVVFLGVREVCQDALDQEAAERARIEAEIQAVEDARIAAEEAERQAEQRRQDEVARELAEAEEEQRNKQRLLEEKRRKEKDQQAFDLLVRVVDSIQTPTTILTFEERSQTDGFTPQSLKNKLPGLLATTPKTNDVGVTVTHVFAELKLDADVEFVKVTPLEQAIKAAITLRTQDGGTSDGHLSTSDGDKKPVRRVGSIKTRLSTFEAVEDTDAAAKQTQEQALFSPLPFSPLHAEKKQKEEEERKKQEDAAAAAVKNSKGLASLTSPDLNRQDSSYKADEGFVFGTYLLENWDMLEAKRTGRAMSATDVGQRVAIKKYESHGTLKYFGPHKQEPTKSRCGVVLDQAEGKNNGTIKGEVYFVCEPKFGVFAATSKVSLEKRDKPTTLTVDDLVAHNPSDLKLPPVTVSINKNGGGLGIKFVGPDLTTPEKGNFVSGLRANSVADQTGMIKPGQKMISVNGIDVTSSSKKETTAVFKNGGELIEIVLQYDPVGYQVYDDGAEFNTAMDEYRARMQSEITRSPLSSTTTTTTATAPSTTPPTPTATLTQPSSTLPPSTGGGLSMDYASMGRFALIKVLKQRGIDYSAVSKDKDALTQLAIDSDPEGKSQPPEEAVETPTPTPTPPKPEPTPTPQPVVVEPPPPPTPVATPTVDPTTLGSTDPSPYLSMGRLALVKILKQRRVDYAAVAKDKDKLVELAMSSDPALTQPEDAYDNADYIDPADSKRSSTISDEQSAKFDFDTQPPPTKRRVSEEERKEEEEKRRASILDESISKANEVVSDVDPNAVHMSQAHTDEGALDRVPSWRKRELDTQKREEDLYINSSEDKTGRTISRHQSKKESMKKEKSKAEALLATLGATEEEQPLYVNAPEVDEGQVAEQLYVNDQVEPVKVKEEEQTQEEEEDVYSVPTLATQELPTASIIVNPESKPSVDSDDQDKPTVDDIYGAEEPKKQEGEAATKKQEEEAAAKKQEEEEAARKKQEEEVATKKQAEEEEVAKKKHEEEEAVAKKQAEEDAATKKQEEEAAEVQQQEPKKDPEPEPESTITRGSTSFKQLPKLARVDHSDPKYASEKERVAASVNVDESAKRAGELNFSFDFG